MNTGRHLKLTVVQRIRAGQVGRFNCCPTQWRRDGPHVAFTIKEKDLSSDVRHRFGWQFDIGPLLAHRDQFLIQT